MQRISISNAATQNIGVKNADEQIIGLENAYEITVGTDPYEGEYLVTPSAVTQTLLTENKCMGENVVVAPIPNNYGLITYNGFGLTVS